MPLTWNSAVINTEKLESMSEVEMVALPGVDRPVADAPEGVVPGSCLCGGVAWEVTGKPSLMMNCHCSRCRRGRGAAHATNAFYKLDQFRWLRGEELTEAYKVANAQYFTQHFCRTCGGKTPRVMEKFNRVLVPAGEFDADPGAQPTASPLAAAISRSVTRKR